MTERSIRGVNERWWSYPESFFASWRCWVPSRRAAFQASRSFFGFLPVRRRWHRSSSACFAVGWAVGGHPRGAAPARLQATRDAATRTAVRVSSRWPRRPAGGPRSSRRCSIFAVHSLPYIGEWLLLPLFLILGYAFAAVGAQKHRGILRLVGVHDGGRAAERSTHRRGRHADGSSTPRPSSTAASPTS